MTDWIDEPSPHLADFQREQRERREQKEQREQEARHAAEAHRQNHARLESLKVKLLDRLDAQLDAIAAHQQKISNGTIGDALSPSDARRQIAHIVGIPRLCSRKACQRSRSCRGEPKQCLAVALPLLPPAVIAELALGRRGRRGRKR